MSYFNRLHIQGFRRLKDLDLELRPLCVMVGANGCGKSSFLDAISLLSESAMGGLSRKLSELGGITSIENAHKQNGVNFELSSTITNEKIDISNILSYSLSILSKGSTYVIDKETLYQRCPQDGRSIQLIESNQGKVQSDDEIFPLKELNHLETALSQVPSINYHINYFRILLISNLYYHYLNVDQRSPVRLPQQLRPIGLPGSNGEDLIACLFSLRETNRERFDLIEDSLRIAYPSFDRLEFPPVAAGMMAMAWRDKNFSRPFYMNELSEGMLRYLWLTTLLQSPDLPSITMLDEPEVSLHPELLRLLADQLREASQRTQLFVATHSDSLVRFLEPKEVLAFDLAEDGSAQAHWADTFDLDEWLKDYTLDEVWRMGRMGGRA